MRREALLMIGVALAGCHAAGGDKGEKKVELPAKPPVQTAPASQGAASETAERAVPPGTTIRATGATAPHRTSQVAATGSGLVAAVLVREGDLVTAGQVLARLDTGDVRLRLKQAEAQRRLAQVQLDAAHRELDRLTKLANDKAVPTAQLDQAKTASDAAQAQLDMAETAIAMAHKAERDAEIKAPFAGLVTERLKAEGEWVATMPPSPMIALAEVSPLDLKVDVPEEHLKDLHLGDKVRARIDAVDQVIDGRISRIVPFVHPGTRSFTVIVELPNTDGKLKAGTFAEVEIEPGQAEAQR
jgi:RND family efflux transporter MFP subunit